MLQPRHPELESEQGPRSRFVPVVLEASRDTKELILVVHISEVPRYSRIRFLVASPPSRDLLLLAKHLFFAAMVAIVLAEAQG
jgi:hypothetical protein